MHPASPIRKVFQGAPERRQMFRMFDRHAQRLNRGHDDAGALYAGEWFEIAKQDYQYMIDILPPLWMEWEMFALAQFLTGSVTSIFFMLMIDDHTRYFHGYCDLSVKDSPERMRDAIVDRESRPVKAMTRTERLEHIWSATHDEYRGYADWQLPHSMRGKRTLLSYSGRDRTRRILLDDLTDSEIAAKLPVHLRYLPDAIAA